jgi:hypothetical protein
MTTILGLKTTVGPEAIVLAADYLASFTMPGQGGGQDEVLEQIDFQKIYHEKNFAFSIAGRSSALLKEFWKRLQLNDPENPEYINLKDALEMGFFSEVQQLNLEACVDEVTINPSNQTSFLFATNFDERPRFFSVYPMGAVNELKYCAATGSGSEFIDEKISSAYTSHSLDGPQINLEQAVKLADKCITLARSDIYSKAIVPDIAIITEDSITYHGPKMRANFEKFKEKELQKIITKHTR